MILAYILIAFIVLIAVFCFDCGLPAKYLSGGVCKLEKTQCYAIIMMSCAGLDILLWFHLLWHVLLKANRKSTGGNVCRHCSFINSVSKQWCVPKLCLPSGSLQI